MITVDQLFAEDFKPQWLSYQEAMVKASFDHAITAEIDLKWRIEAEAKAKKIALKHAPKVRLPRQQYNPQHTYLGL